MLLGGVNYFTGQWFDLERIVRCARAQGCVVGLDLAPAIGTVPLALHGWGVDFAVWCSYKYRRPSSPGSISSAGHWAGDGALSEFFFNNLSEGRHVNGFTDVVFCPLWVNHLSRVLIAMLEKDLSGLYHVVGSQAINKYQFGLAVARTFGLREDLISPRSVEESGLIAKRSHNLWLSIHKLSTDLGWVIPSYSTGLDGFYKQYQQGYPQKIKSYQH